MTAFSNYLENKLLDHTLRGPAGAFAAPAQVFVSLHTASPGETGSPSNEVSGGSYARQTASFNTAASGSTSNSANIAFSNMPAVTVTHVAIYDALTTGNLLFYGALTVSRVVAAGDTFVINSGQLTITLD